MEQCRIIADLNDPSTYETFLSASRFSIPILYEDNHLLIVVKPEGVLSQSDGSGAPDMLALLKEYIKAKSGKPGDVFLGLVHRLDRPVSGVMVFAKTSKGASRISEQIREKKMRKKYYAVVHGTVAGKEEGTLRSKLHKNTAQNSVNTAGEEEEGKEAVLHYKFLASDKETNRSLADITLETGRSHQIRVQLADRGNPILGDKKYGNPNESYKGEIALFSYSLLFKHPTRDLEIQIEAVPIFKQAWKTFSSVFQNAAEEWHKKDS